MTEFIAQRLEFCIMIRRKVNGVKRGGTFSLKLDLSFSFLFIGNALLILFQ